MSFDRTEYTPSSARFLRLERMGRQAKIFVLHVSGVNSGCIAMNEIEFLLWYRAHFHNNAAPDSPTDNRMRWLTQFFR